MTFESPQGPAWLFFGVFAAVVIGPVVAGRLRLPPIIGLLAGGLVIGPHVLDIVPSTDTTLSDLGQLGLLYLMFSAGVELDLALFQRYRRAAVTFGLLTFSAPMVLGIASGLALDYSVAAALLLGSLWASHTLVNYPAVRQAGLSGDPAVATTVGATVITDTLSLVVLAGVAGSVTGDSGLAEILASLAVGLVLLAVYAGAVLPRVARWFFAGPGHERTVRYAFLLVALLSSATLAEVVGIEGIVGAFFAGLGLNRLVPDGGALGERIEFVGSSVLIPVFLVSVGVLIDPSVVVDPGTLGLAAVFTAAVLGGKAIAAGAARPVLGFSAGQAGLMFSLSGAQAAATLAATFVGFDIGLFGEKVVNAVLVVILVSLLVTAVTTARFAGRVEPAPAEPGGGGLGRTVVVPVAREDRLPALARAAARLVQREGGVVVPIRVTPPGRDLAADLAFLSLAEGVLAREGLDTEARLRVDRDATGGVVHCVAEERATVLLLDWHAATRQQPVLLGGRDDELVAASPVPVVLAALSDAPVTRVVLAADELALRPESGATMALAADVAGRLRGGDADLVAVGPDREALSAALGPVRPDALDGSCRDRTGWVAERVAVGDLVVLPAGSGWDAFGPAALVAAAKPGVSVVAVVAPERWSARGPAVQRGLGMVRSR